MSAPPDFRQRLENTNSRQGQPVKLIAVVTGNPTPVVQWYREGMEIESSKDFQIAVEGQQHTLTINDPYPEDTGVFLISASNNFGKATSTAHIAIEAASSDEEFTMKTVTSTKKTVTQMESVQTKQSIKKTTKTAISSTTAVGLPPGLNPTEAQKQFASVFSSVGGGLKKKKVKKQKVHSSAETEYETVAETETEAQTEVTTEVAFTETEAEMSSVEQVSSSKISPAVPRKPTAAELIKKPQLEIGSPLNKKTQIQGFRSVQAVTGKIHNVSKSKQVDIQINRESAQSLAYGQSKSYTGGVVRHVTAPTGPRSRDPSAERFDTDAVNTDQEEMAVEQVEVEDGGEEVEVASIASTPEPTDIQSELEDVPQEPFAPRFDILPEDTGVVEGDIAVLQATISAWPEPYISWFREGATIEDCPDYQVSYEDGIAQLTIRNCYPDDAGTFTVSARNQMGSTSATCVLSVKSTSEYDREQQQDQFAGGYEESANDTPGSGVECSEPETTDNEELTRTRTSKVLSPVGEIDENASLNSPERRGPTSPEQVLNQAMEIVAEAEERLAATSPGAPQQDNNLLLPSDSDAAPASTSPVPGQPRFMTVPDRCILLQEGATQVFEACAPNCHVFWERDGKPIIGGYRVKTEENEKRGYAAITINMVFPEDAGEYVAVAVNRFGRVTHSVYFLTPEHYTAFMRKGGEVPTGLTDYTSSDNEPRGTTSDSDREGRPMSRGDLNKIKKGVGIKQSASSLTRRTPSPGPRAVSKSPMRGASPSGKGLQNVDAKDLAKVYKPVFLVKAINQEILEGKSARINIRVTGRPPPVMSWFKNGEPVIQDEVRRVTIQENGVESYILDATAPEDSAEYTIMAENAGGRAVSSCKLTILPAEEAQRPKILDKPVSTKVNAGESVRLEVFAVGRPTPEICWLKDNQLLQPDKHTNFQFEGVDGHGLLIVEKADKSHDGWYTATAVNKAGRDLCRCKLSVAVEATKDDSRHGRSFKTGKGMKKKADASPGRHTGKLTRAPEEFDEKDLYDATQQQKPFFKQKIESIKTTTLGGAHFECRLIPIGDPTMKVQWLLDDKPLEHANRIQTMFEFGYTSLDILNCYPRDTGVISCRATNANGGTETSATLIVKEDRSTKFAQKEGRAMELISQKEKEMRPPSESPTHSVSPTKEMSDDVIAPQIVSVPEDIETAEGQTMRFHVRATGNPPPKLEWYLNGQQIRKSKRFQLWYDGLHHLEINPARAYDTGSLVAVAVNKVGQAQASCTVDVEPLGDLRSNLKRVDGSSPDAALRAMRMNRKVEGEKQAEVFEEVQLRRTSMNKSPTKDPRKSAAYDADLRAKFKNVRTEEHQMTAARVSVQKKMKHYDQVEHEELLKKTKRELEHWETPEDTPTPTSSKKEGLSHAINVEIPDFSGIKVEAKDEFRPPVITKRLTDTKFDSDQDAKIQVKFNGMPEPELMWFQNGEELSQTERKYWKFIDNQTCELNILKIQKSDEGQYAARVANRAGEELSTCVISITEIKRKILEGPRSQEWNAENTAKFEVVVSHKDMDGEWYKDGVAVDQNEKFVAEDLGSGRRRLTIYNLIKIDEGIYEYVYGGDRAAATLTVHAKPISIVQNLADQVVVASESATFECTLSDVTTDGTWFKNGQPLEQSERHFTAADGVKQILLIENVTAEDIGEYAFAIDEVHTIAQLNLMSNEQQIQIVQHLQAASCLEGSAAEFVCAVEPEQYSNGKWFKNGVELQIDNSRMSYNQVQGGFKELIIRNCTANDNGAYTFVAGTQETVAELQVTEIEILEPLKNQSVDVGGEVLFETLLSHANVQGVWFKNNVPFKISDKSQVFIDDNVQALYLRELTAEDAGIYSFRAGNKITECELEVVSFDVFKMGLQDLRMKSSETAVFHAELNVDLEGAWFRDGQQLQMNDRVKSSSSGLHRELVIEDLQRADEGIYTYSTGNADSSATLYVEVAYIIPKNFKDIVVQETSSAEFECEVTKPNLETHWFKDGVEIDPTNDKYEILTQGLSYKLRINNCTVNDNCEVVFLAEDESVAANLQVKPIDIVEDINDEVQAEGKDVTFCCKTSAVCQPRWSKDNMILKPRDNKYQIKSDGVLNYLTVKNVNMEDAGSYTCHVGNNESNATLYVEVAQINFVSETAINVQASVEQEMAQIEFQVNKEGVKGKWFHNGIDVNIDNVKYNYVVDRTYHKLIVKQLNVADSGDYTFEANKNLTATASLRVEAKPIAPQWIRQLANAKSELMGNAHFEVEVVGAPTPIVSFYKNGTQITESSKYNLKSAGNVHSLDINCCTEADVCQYTCTAKNSAGSTMTSAQLSIVEAYDMQYEQPAAEQSVEPPVITRKFESQTSKAGARVVFECEYVGTEPTVRWSKNGNEIQQNNGIQIVNDMHYTALVITSAQHLISGGDYAVEIFNAAGSASNKATLTVQGSPPEVAERPEGGDWQIGESMRLVAKITGEPAPQVHWEYNGKEVNSQRFKIYEANGYAFLELENCEGKDSGKYTVVGENELGQAKWTVTIACRNLTPDATGRPQSASSARSVEVITQKRTTSDGQQVVTNEEVAVATPSPPQANSPPVASPPKIASPVDVPVQKKQTPKLDLSPKPQKKVAPADVTSPTSPDFVKFDVEEERKKSKVRKTPLKLNIPEKKQDTENKLKRAPEAMTPLPEQDKPEFIVCPESADVTIGSEAEIACRIAGNPTPEIQWYKGKWGKLAAVGRISIGFNVQSGVSTLNIKKVQKPDKGLYRCVATNKNGSAEAEFTLNVAEKQQTVEKVDRFSLKTKPKVEKEVVSEFDAVKMLRDVDPKEYEKYANHFGVKDFRHLLTTYEELKPEIENDDIEMPEMLLTPESAISMVEEEELWEKAVETIGTKPVDVLQDIRDVVVATHGDAIFEAEIRINVPGVDVKWFKEETPLHEGDKYSMSREGDVHSLLIRNVNSDDEGDYRVEAGKHQSSASLKVVLPEKKKTPPKQERVKTPPKQKAPVRGAPEPVPVTPPPIQEKVEAPVQAQRVITVEEPLKDLQVPIEGDAIFETVLNCMNAEPAWTKNGQPIKRGPQCQVEEEPHKKGGLYRMTLKACALGDDAKVGFSCAGDQCRQSASFEVMDLPLGFTRELKDIETVEYTPSVTFECHTTRQGASATWYANGRPVEDGGKYNIVSRKFIRRLVVNDLSKKDNYPIKCRITDKGDSAETSGKLATKDEPIEIVGALEDKEGYALSDVTLQAVLDKAGVDYEWYHNDQLIQADKDVEIEDQGECYSLTFKNCPMDRAGKIEFRAARGRVTTACNLTLVEPQLQFVVPLEDQEVGEKEAAEFTVKLSKPIKYLEWTLNQEKLKSGGNITMKADKKNLDHTLYLDEVTKDMEGELAVEAEGVRSTAQLTVTKDLKFTGKLKDTDVVEGEDAVFEATVSNADVPVQWFKNGIEITPEDPRLKIKSEGRKRFFTIPNCSKADEAEYSCKLGDKSSSAALHVDFAPVKFTKQIMDTGAAEGAVATFECELSRDEPVQWFKNGKEKIMDGPKYTIEVDGLVRRLKINDVSYSDEAKFACQVGDTKTVAALAVQTVAIEFVVALEDKTVSEGERAEFNVQLNVPDVKPIQWFQNGIEMSPKSGIEIKSSGENHMFAVASVSMLDTSEIMFNAGGSRSACQLKVTQTPLKFVKVLAENAEAENKMAMYDLECELNRQNANVKWYLNDKEIFPSRKFAMAVDGAKRILTISDITKDDEGIYHCQADDQKTQTNLKVVPADVRFMTSLEDCSAFERDSFTFEVEISHVNMEGEWFKDGQKVSSGKNTDLDVKGTAHLLTINDCSKSDAGQYKFVVEGKSCECAFTVKDTPAKFLKRLQDESSTEKEEIALSCEVNRPNAEVVWKHNGEPIVADDRIEIVSDGRRRALVIKSVVQADEGDYSCDAGDDETTCTLCVGGRDIRFTKKMIDQEIIEGEKVTFELGLSHDDVQGEWSVNGEVVKNSDDVEIACSGRKHTLTLENTKVAQTGPVIFKVASGPKCEARLEVIEAPCTFTAPINDITALENENAVFECQVSKADAEVTWYKGRTKIHMSDKYEMVAVEYKRSLIIKSAGFDDESQFSAQVGDNKCAAKLTITSKVITLSDCFEDQNKTVGETIELTVKASEMGEDAKWMINGIQLKADDNVEFIVDGPVYGLRIKNATLDMAGDVTVSVLNAKHTAALNITDGPASFTKKLEDVSIENKSKSLELTAELNRGNVNVTWLRDGAEIVPSRKFDIVKRKTVCTLVIADITKEDGAAYTCDCGDEQTVSNVTVVDQNITVVGNFPDEKVVIERETLDIEVEISHEDVEVTWELVREGKDNEVMVASKSCELSSFRTVHNLKVFNCELDLTGTMLFKAGNLVKEIKVTVKEPGARFTKRLADQSATETDAAVFECEISRANAEVEWFLNDVKIEESDKFVIESSNRRRVLTINNCSSADEGKVRCSSEDDETLAELQIEGRDIKILKKLSDQEVTEGEEVTFELDVNYADIKGKWTVNEVDVEEGDAYEMAVKGKKQILKIKSATSDNAGLIVWCSGKTKGTANLSVLEAPAAFTVPLKDTTAEEKSVCTLEAELNRGNVKTRWLKDRRVPIQTSDKYEIIDDGKVRKLVIKDVTYDDEGAYTCDAETAKSNMALTVCARDIKLTAPMRDSTAAEKGTGVMSFELSHSEVSTTWFRNGQKLAKSRLIEMTCEPCENGFRYSLNIKEIGQDDGGVIAFNAEGIQGEANLEVCATPVDIIDELKRTVCRQGDNITLSVKVSDPLPVGQWFINGVKLARSDRMAIANDAGVHTLKIKNVTTDEMGEAVFVCNNARTSADVIVKDPKVTFSQKLIDQSATEKAVVEFETEVNRINAQIEWVDAAGNVIEESGRFEFVSEGRKRRLIIEGVLLADEGYIKARAAPEFDPLDFANKVRDVQAQEGGEALFDCDVNQPDQAIEWFYDGNKLEAGSKYEFVSDKFRKSLIVKNCTPDDIGFYKAELSNCKSCEAELTVGAEGKANAPRPSYQPEASQEKPNEVSAKLTVKARDIKIRRHLQDQECFEGESVEFQCETSFSDVTPHWTCNGVLLKENGQTVIFEQSGARQRLILKEVQGTQAGTIEFYGKTKANLHVIEQPVDFTEEMEPVSVYEKETAKFHAKVSRANAKVKWFKGRRMLKEGSARYEMIADGCNRLLIIKKSEFNDEKDYTCSCDDAIVTAKLTVNPRDIKMVKPLEDITVNEKQDAIFECELSHDEVETAWFRDGAKIIKSGQIIMESDGRIARLIIKNVNQEDDDQCDIQCRAEDAVTSAILTVKPTILEILDPLEEKYLCPEGEEFTFQVRVSQPGVAGEWYMNGNQIRRSVDVEIKPAKGDVHKIVFKKMHKGLMGQLKFRITKNGASCQANIKVKGPDCKVVQKLPEELMGQAGQPMVFECKLNRAPDQDASGWKKDGVFIDPFDPKYKVEEKDGGKHQRLIIPKPDPTDAGFYAFDTGDEETICKALVKEQDAVFDEKLPSELKLKTEQENAKLQCSTNIAKNVELKWTKDGVEVTGDDYERIDEGCVHILQIKQVGQEHAGRYQCELVKSGDKTYCNVAVEDSPFQSDPVTKSIFVGESAEFEVMVKDNASKVIWSVNGKTGESRFEDSESGFTRRFKVSAAELSDNGPIVAVVEGRESKPVTCQFNVYDHLVVTKKPENWSGKENAEVTMVAEVNKNAKVTWYNNKRAISPDDEKYTIASEGCVHSIKFNATKEDDGATIEATFGAELDEYVSTSGSLDVACGMSAAKIDVGDADREIVRGERAEIAFELRGKPEPEITVTNQDRNKEQTVIQSEEVKVQRLIVIESVTNEDAGTYTIVAKNSEGSDNAALHVRVVARPDAPEGITVTKMTNDACGFCWKAPNKTGGLPIVMYEIGWRYAEDEAWTELKTKDETTNYFLMGLKKDSAIELKVAAVNRAGTGAWSEQVGPHKVSDGVFPPGYPVNVKVDKAGVTAKAVPMSWDEPASDGGAPVTGYEIEKQLDGMDGWEPCGKTADKNFTVEDPAVKDGKAYKFRVKAVNEAGVSGGSEPTDLINVEDPNLRPGAPSKVHADNPSTDSIDVSWKVPPSEQPITGYVVEKLKSGATEWAKCGSAAGDQQAITVVDLEPGTAYNFRAFAENESGMSHPSEMSNACTTLDGAAPDVEPQLIPEQTHYQANRGEPFNAKVKVLGRPQCEVEWKRGSEAWFEYARYGGGFAQISIPAAQGTDSGEYTVTATNRAGSASATITVQIIDVPAEPVNLDVKPQNGGICFSWNAPKNDGGEQIAGYIVEYKDAESDWVEGANPVDCEHVFDDLPKGGTFRFRVAAYNKIGQGAFAEFGNEVGTAGGVVTNLHVTSTTDDSVSLAWDAPKNEKVTAALGYTVERLGEGMDPSLWVVHNPGSPAKSCKYTCNHLEFMSRWQFRVKCISEFGPGEPCEPTDWVTVEMDKTPPTVDLWEGAEDGLSVKVTQNRMIMPAKITGRPQPEVSWVKGDYPLSVDSRVSIANTDKMSTFTMADLTRADSGEYTVIAENENGVAEKKVMVNVMDTPAAPEDFDISDITNKSATLVWKAPLDDGGTPIRNYCVEKREVGRSVWGKITSEIAPDVTTYEVTRLLEGREYEFRVSARNDLGLGDGALSAPIIANYLFEVPEQCDPPTILETSITKSGMTAKWNSPEFDGGSPITGYWLEMSNPDSTRWSKVNRKPIEAGKRTYKVANLKEGREYIFRVCAENLAGRGAWSDPSEPECALDPLAVPGRPGKPEVLAVGDTTASLKWKAPKEGAESIEHYVLEMRKRPQTDMEAEREAAAAAEAERKMKAMTWISRLPEYKEVEIAAPEIVLQVELNEGINDKIHWKKDGQRLKQGNGIEFISEGNIRILKITKTVSESDQGTYTAKVGGKKCECQVSVSLFMNDNNNVNSNNNISKLKLEEPKFNVESAFLTFEPKQQRDHFEAVECPPVVDEYQTIDAAMDACGAAVNANCSTQSSPSCDKNWNCGAKRDSETIDSEYELNPCPNGNQISHQNMPQKETRNEKSNMKPP